MWQKTSIKSFQQTYSVSVCQFTVTAVHTSSLTSKTLCTPMLPSTVSLASNKVTAHTLRMHSVYAWHAEAKMRSSANSCWQTGYWSSWPNQIWLWLCTLPVGCVRYQSTADVFTLGTGGTGNHRQLFSWMFEALQWHIILWQTGVASCAIRRSKQFWNFFIPCYIFTFSFFSILYYSVAISFSFERIFTFSFPFALT